MPPAVGEKNKDEGFCLGGVPALLEEAKGLVGFEVLMGAAESLSSDMLELAPTTLYNPRFLPGTADMALMSARFCCIAARFTERCRDQATRPRHRRTAAPRAPRAAPTQMKTVPSGRFDFCMYGAAWVSGTPTDGIPTPANEGRPVRWKADPADEGGCVLESVGKVAVDCGVDDVFGAEEVFGVELVEDAP